MSDPATPGSAPDDLAPGMQVGEYVVEGKLGEGGMGSVYGARHPLIGKRAAIKVINREMCASADAVDRFVREAQAVNQINHPNIIDIFAFGSLADGRSYFVMELLRGESLRAHMDRERPSYAESLEILGAVAKALEAAHEAGIVHRDLKPDNIFLEAIKGERPRVKLLDFGLAKLTGVGTAAPVEHTRTGMVMGTPLYISPEQARGKQVDLRADIYALGCIGYELFLGKPPFVAETAVEIMAQHITVAPRPARELWPQIPPALEALIHGMLEKEPERRPPVGEVRQKLGELLADHTTQTAQVPALHAPVRPVSEAPASKRGKGLVLGGIGAVVVAGVVAFAVTRWGREGTASPPAAPATATTTTMSAGTAPAGAPVAAATPAGTPGKLQVRVNVDNARIVVDGRTVAESAAEASPELAPGVHVVQVSAPRRAPYTGEVRVEAGQTAVLAVRLERGSGGPAHSAPIIPPVAPPAQEPATPAPTPAPAVEPPSTPSPAPTPEEAPKAEPPKEEPPAPAPAPEESKEIKEPPPPRPDKPRPHPGPFKDPFKK